MDKRDIAEFHKGYGAGAYRWMGAHPAREHETNGFRFTVWAPHAERVFVVLPDWAENARHELNRFTYGVWSGFVPYAGSGQKYFFEMLDANNRGFQKADPYAFRYEMRPDKCSLLHDFGGLDSNDDGWNFSRQSLTGRDRPVNIYEVHAGTWRKHWYGKFYSYREMARELGEYCSDNGYTHIELLPITEHPLDQSWGYQPSGFFAPTARFGSPEDFKFFVEECHRYGLGVILDWVPSHFCVDGHALAYFDGRPCYEYETAYMTHGNRWGAHCFDLGRGEVRSFLKASALFWLDVYNVDGIRVDAVADLLDIRNRNKNNAAVGFIRELHEEVFKRFPYALMMAEDSVMRGDVTKPWDHGGLGFTHQWNMGWTYDVLSFLRKPPEQRRYSINEIAKTLDYATHEQFVIPLSHDISQSGALRRFPGKTKEKLEQFKLLYSYFIMHPGAKLSFMGTEWGGRDVWRMHKEIGWPKSRRGSKHYAREFVRELNRIYLREPLLWKTRDRENFSRLNRDDNGSGVLVLSRRAGYDLLIAVLNFSDRSYPDYLLGIQLDGEYVEICRSDEKGFGGKIKDCAVLASRPEPYAGEPNRINVRLPAYGAVILKRSHVE